MDLNAHASTCPNCYAPAGRFCEAAKAIRIDEDSDYFVADLVKIAKRQDREAYMAKYCKTYFDFPALKAAITEKYQQIKKREHDARTSSTASA